jgi:predicted nicotinamide N-methyase
VERAEGRAAGPLAVMTSPPANVADAPSGFRARIVEAPGGAVTLFESDDVDRDLDAAIARGGPTPYGRVLWPSAVACAASLLALAPRISATSVVELGCGTGLVSLVALRAGMDVVATDVDDGALEAARAAASRLSTSGTFRAARFDVRGAEPLPAAHVVVAADLLYEEVLAAALARRCIEALAAGAHVIVGDPGRVFRTRFDVLVRDGAALAADEPRWVQHDDVVVATLSPRPRPQGGG